jgi:hypothetical protein
MDRSGMRSLPIVAILAVQGCGGTSNIRSEGPFPYNSDGLASREGVRYYVARDIITLEARVIKGTSKVWIADSAAIARNSVVKDGLCKASPPKTQWDTTHFTLLPVVVPDMEEGAFRLGMRVNAGASQNLNIDVSQTGLLKNVSIDVQDQRPEMVANVIQGVAGIAGSLVGAAASAILPAKGISNLTYLTAVSVVRDSAQVLLTDDNCYIMSGRNSKGTELKRQIETLEAETRRAEDDRLRLQTRAMAVTDGQRARALRAGLAVADSRVIMLKDRLASATSAYILGRAAYKNERGVGKKTDTTMIRSTFDVVDLGDIETTHQGEIAADEVSKLSGARRFLADSGRLIVVIRDLPRPSKPLGASTETAFGCDALTDTDCVKVAFRKPRPRLVTVYARRHPTGDKAEAAQNFGEVSRTILPLASSDDLTLVQSFQTKAFAKEKLSLTFGDHGDVVGVVQVGDGGMALATGKLVEGLSKARTEFTSGLSTVSTAQASVYGIQRAQLQRQVQRLQDEKSLVDAQIALQGANATADLQVRSALLDSQIKALTSEQNLNSAVAAGERQPLVLSTQDIQAQLVLANAQASLQQQPFQSQLALLTQQQALLAGQNAGALAQQLADIQASIAQLRAQIDLVNQQMALQKAKQDLERLRESGGTQP